MQIKFAVALTTALLLAVGSSGSATADQGGVERLQHNSPPTAWSRMRHRNKMMHRQGMRGSRKGGATAAGSAPNGRGTGMGPTGQPSGVK